MDKLLYTGKAKDIFSTNKDDEIRVHYKNQATAFNAVKKAQIEGKGELNNEITCLIFKHFMKKGIKTHFIKKLDSRNQICKRVTIIPLEVIIRNVAAGSFAKNYGVEDGTLLAHSTFEVSYKVDELRDPLMVKDHAIALNICTSEEYEYMRTEAFKINEILRELFLSVDIKLVDFKIEFGKLPNGEIVLADEFSPDNARLWDVKTNKRLDKDVFRKDLGNITDTYGYILSRLKEII